MRLSFPVLAFTLLNSQHVVWALTVTATSTLVEDASGTPIPTDQTTPTQTLTKTETETQSFGTTVTATEVVPIPAPSETIIKTELVTGTSTTSTPRETPTPSASTTTRPELGNVQATSRHMLKSGAIAGISVGVVMALIVIVILVWTRYRSKCSSPSSPLPTPLTEPVFPRERTERQTLARSFGMLINPHSPIERQVGDGGEVNAQEGDGWQRPLSYYWSTELPPAYNDSMRRARNEGIIVEDNGAFRSFSVRRGVGVLEGTGSKI
ncbi:hypothetical protein E1B28_006869 [Marasmius oreades]|uniref:Mid2 domain-containing protein n=1 Tax=Marasmius oreades TaxID=181124 RepID=A0A9P7S0R4_9AGAR|nr:uncharacterized protein E1B28_006869 [Marasmius oreades]KAG7093180.1 hypothetical protein E1B28_006869 [Marasmius oreades]